MIGTLHYLRCDDCAALRRRLSVDKKTARREARAAGWSCGPDTDRCPPCGAARLVVPGRYDRHGRLVLDHDGVPRCDRCMEPVEPADRCRCGDGAR